MDSLEKLNEQKKINEGIFNNIFKKKQQQNKILIEVENGYLLNGNFIGAMYGDGYTNPYDEDVWLNPEYKWMLLGNYKAYKISIENKNINFQGIWNDGEFKGKEFLSGNNVFFVGGQFNGKTYAADNLTYKTSPENFINGTFEDYENGILGTKIYENEILNSEENIELIRVPDNWFVTIKGDRNKILIFKIIKKLNNKDSNFVFKLIPSMDNVSILWETIRNSYEKIGVLKNGAYFDLFENYVIKNIKSISVTKTIDDFKISSKNVISFALDKNLKNFVTIKKIPISFEVESNSVESKEFVEKFISDLKTGVFYQKLILLKKYIDNGLISGYLSFIHLSSIFDGKIGQTTKNQKLDNEINNLMQYFDNFMNFLVEETVKIGIKNIITKSLKNFLIPQKNIIQNIPSKETSGDKEKKEKMFSTLKNSLKM